MKRILLVLLLLPVLAQSAPWKLSQIQWNGLTDSTRLNVYHDGILGSTALDITGRQSWDTVLVAQEGKLNVAVHYIWFAGQDYPSTWPHTRDLKQAAEGYYPWYLSAAVFPAAVDSCELWVYRDTLLQGAPSRRVAGTLGYNDTVLTAYAGSYNSANIVLYFVDQDSGIGWPFVWDMTDTSTGVALPGDPTVTRVWGVLLRPDKTKIAGARITATRVSGENAAATSNGVGVVVSGLPTGVYSDTSGYFQMYLVGTGTYSDTTRGYYNIRGEYGGQTLFDLPRLYIPTGTVVNIADSLSLRTR